jgi:peptidoglycan/xylan/chitin deacetylase (PgdA/CDA1 family)
MRLVSPFLKHVVYPGLAGSGYLRRRGGAGPAVVTYHGILPARYRPMDAALDGSLVTPDALRRQIRLLKTRYSLISPEEFLLWCEAKQDLPPRSVMLTCDDGLRNTLTDMLPILQQAGAPCLFFVTGASLDALPSMLWYEELFLMFLAGQETFAFEIPRIGLTLRVTSRRDKRPQWWNLVKKLSRHPAGSRQALIEEIRIQLGLAPGWNARYRDPAELGQRFLLLNLHELRQLAAAGMSVGAHTVSHPMLSELPPEAAWTEIAQSRNALEQHLRQPVWALAYPFGSPGSLTRRELDMAARAGFTCAFVNVAGGLGAETPRFALPRVHVTSGMSLAEFEAHVSGFCRALRERFWHSSAGSSLDLSGQDLAG